MDVYEFKSKKMRYGVAKRYVKMLPKPTAKDTGQLQLQF